jgi:hypothetical protein
MADSTNPTQLELLDLTHRVDAIEEDGNLVSSMALSQRIHALEAEHERPKDKFDVATLIGEHLETQHGIEVVEVNEKTQGPLGGTSSQVLLKLVAPRGTYRYVAVNVYDDGTIQKYGAARVQAASAQTIMHTVKEGDLLP